MNVVHMNVPSARRIRVHCAAAFIACLVLAVADAGARVTTDSATLPRSISLNAAFAALIPDGTPIETIASGHKWLEGPVWDRRQAVLLFSDIPQNRIFSWRQGRDPITFLSPSGYSGKAPFTGPEPGSNGLVFDAAGRLVICQHGDRRIARLDSDGTLGVLADRYQGRRLNSPNDAVFNTRGDLYFTDPPFGLPGTFRDPGRELPFSGVYRLTPAGQMTLVISDIKAPNGIAFSPDERTLYVTDVDPDGPAWLAYDVHADGSVTNGRVLVDAMPFTRRWKGAPDGLKVDRDGNIFAAGPGGVYVFSVAGAHLGTIETGVPTANVAWGDDGSTLYITAADAILRLRTRTRGAGW